LYACSVTARLSAESCQNAFLLCFPHKVRTYKEYHSVCPSSELGLPPTPHPQASVPPPPCFWGEGNTRWRERGFESPNSDEGHTLWYSLYVRTVWFPAFFFRAFSIRLAEIPPNLSIILHTSLSIRICTVAYIAQPIQKFKLCFFSSLNLKSFFVLCLEGDSVAGICYVGTRNTTFLAVFVLAPLVLYLILGEKKQNVCLAYP
jgi:hypothetical protein